ncbi:hypothetical protein BVY01_01610 [bacterium I07]|nr:hypothetical protein BVY01_01610 [bacterium I07]
MDSLTTQAVLHTRHCLTGCAIGEVLGIAIGSEFHWHRYARVALAVVLAFCFGYLLTIRGVIKQTSNFKEAVKITFATDTIAITSMEIVDNFIELLIPRALSVTLSSARFWWSLALSLTVAFIMTVPVNRFMISRTSHMHHH